MRQHSLNKRTPRLKIAAASGEAKQLRKSLDEVNGFFDVFVGLIDVLKSALLEALGRGIVFFLGDVVVSFVDEFE
jgi:hypothetical protein